MCLQKFRGTKDAHCHRHVARTKDNPHVFLLGESGSNILTTKVYVFLLSVLCFEWEIPIFCMISGTAWRNDDKFFWTAPSTGNFVASPGAV